MNRSISKSKDAVTKNPKRNPSKPVGRDPEIRLFKDVQKPEVTEWVIFKLHAPPMAKVYVAGTFNNWNPAALRLNDNNTGTYSATVRLPMGNYEYKFIVNGEWLNGPNCNEQVPNAFGTTNNVLVVKRTTPPKAHLRAFSRMPVSEDRPQYTSPLGE